MIDLISNFTIPQILLCGVGIILAVKGAWDLIDYFKNKYKEKFNKDYDAKKKEETLLEHYYKCRDQHKETISMYNDLGQKIDNLTDTVNEKFDEIDKQMERLTQSDMHDIKQAIVQNYHYFVEKQGWIDDFSLDTLELRYADYVAENGNSYIGGLMSELRQLPKHPPI